MSTSDTLIIRQPSAPIGTHSRISLAEPHACGKNCDQCARAEV